MSLPKLTAPIFTIEMPSNKKSVKFRPFTVKEEKLLLLASESEEPKFINDTITQVLNNCFIDDIDIGILATFDVEYLFLKLRSTPWRKRLSFSTLPPMRPFCGSAI